MTLPTVLRLPVMLAGPRWQSPFTGPTLRAALGARLRLLACTRACGDGPCRVGAGCGYHDAFEPERGPAPYRFDAADLDRRELTAGDTGSLLLVAFDDTSATRLTDAVRFALAEGLGRDRTRFVVGEPAPVPFDPLVRAATLGPFIRVRLASPTELVRDGRPITAPTPLDVLHGARHRARELGLALPDAPRFEPEVEAEGLAAEAWRGWRWSTRQQREIPVRGALATWAVRPTPAQAWWFALAELVGVGKGTAMGKGAVRCHPDR